MSTASSLLFLGLLVVGSIGWAWLLAGWRAGRAPFPWRPREDPTWHPAMALLAIALVAMLVAAATSKPLAKVTLESIRWNCGTLLALVALILVGLAWQSPRKGLAEYGITFEGLAGQIGDGLRAYSIAILPVVAALRAMAPLLTPETQNPLLQLLRDERDAGTIAWAVMAAVAVAPVYEELLYRVVLQGWLETKLPAGWAVVIGAVAFSAMHGWRDAIPLFPLALVLGWLYRQRRRYLANIAAHAVFNAIFLAIAIASPAE